jgi:hypothetical protein
VAEQLVARLAQIMLNNDESFLSRTETNCEAMNERSSGRRQRASPAIDEIET